MSQPLLVDREKSENPQGVILRGGRRNLGFGIVPYCIVEAQMTVEYLQKCRHERVGKRRINEISKATADVRSRCTHTLYTYTVVDAVDAMCLAYPLRSAFRCPAENASTKGASVPPIIASPRPSHLQIRNSLAHSHISPFPIPYSPFFAITLSHYHTITLSQYAKVELFITLI